MAAHIAMFEAIFVRSPDAKYREEDHRHIADGIPWKNKKRKMSSIIVTAVSHPWLETNPC